MKTPLRILWCVTAMAAPMFVPMLAAAEARPAAAPVDKKQAAQQAAVDKVFDLSKLHVIDIVIRPEELGRFTQRIDDRLHATFTFDGLVLENVGVRQAGGDFHPYRGIGNKPSLSLKFNEFVKGQKLHGLEKLVLKNQIQDLSLVNEHLTYEVFRRAGLAAAMTAYAVVTINGQSNGIYLMREPVNKEFMLRNFGSGNEDGNLYEFDFNSGDIANNPRGIPLKNEAEDKRSRDDIIELAAVLTAVPTEFFVPAAARILDIDRYVTYFATEAVTSDMDGFSFHNNNSYLYRLPKDGRFVLIPHGADEAFWATGTAITKLSGPFHPPYAALARTVRAVPALLDKYRAEVTRISSPPVWDEAALLERVAQVGRLLATAERKGQTAIDISRFESYRRVVEGFIRSHGTTQNGPGR
jgi:spore coat protein CotH